MLMSELDSMDVEEIGQSLSCYGEVLSFPICIEDHVSDASAVEKRIFIGNKRIGMIISGDGKWNVIEESRGAIIPFVTLMDAIVYILKEEGYL